MRRRHLLESFGYAFRGLGHALRSQRNLWLQAALGALALGLGIILGLSLGELALLVALITLVLVAELFNTALEALVDLASPELHPLARVAKDVAAGAVLAAAIGAVVVGALLFAAHLP